MPEEMNAQPAKTFGASEDESENGASPDLSRENASGGRIFFSDALQEIDSAVLLQRIQLEFVTLCNQVASADQKEIQTREALRAVVEKVCGYVNIGLEAKCAEGCIGFGKTRPRPWRRWFNALLCPRFSDSVSVGPFR